MPPLLYLGALVTGVVAKGLLGGSIAPGSTLRLVAGAGLAVAGIVVGVGFSRVFARAGQDRSPRTPTPAIVSDGLYRWSRNPAYVSLTAILLGLGLLLDNAWLLVIAIPVVLVMHFGVILREEAYLERKFGDEYLRYKAQVRRWL